MTWRTWRSHLEKIWVVAPQMDSKVTGLVADVAEDALREEPEVAAEKDASIPIRLSLSCAPSPCKGYFRNKLDTFSTLCQ